MLLLFVVDVASKTEKYNFWLTNFQKQFVITLFHEIKPPANCWVCPHQQWSKHLNFNMLPLHYQKSLLPEGSYPKVLLSLSPIPETMFQLSNKLKSTRLTEVLALPVTPPAFQQAEFFKTTRSLIAPRS